MDRDTKRQIPRHCEVCKVVTCDSIRCGVYACEACKKFFLRNRNNDGNLQCISGSNNCRLGEEDSKALVSASGKFWRMMCPKCRLAKCRAVGMRMVHKRLTSTEIDHQGISATMSRSFSGNVVVKTEPTSFPTSSNQMALVRMPSMMTVNPIFEENILCEQTLCNLVEAGRNVMMAFEMLPLRSNNCLENYDETQVFKAGLGHFNCIVQVVKEFTARLPGYSSLPVSDRCALFAVATSTMTLAATNKLAPTMCGLSPINGTRFLSFFKEFEYTKMESENLWNALANWNPNAVEFSFLLALLFYQASVGLPCHSDALKNVRQLKQAVSAYLNQCYMGNPTYVESRFRQLGYLLELLREAGVRRNLAYSELKMRRPNLFTLDRYLEEIHEKNKQSYNKQQMSQQIALPPVKTPAET